MAVAVDLLSKRRDGGTLAFFFYRRGVAAVSLQPLWTSEERLNTRLGVRVQDKGRNQSAMRGEITKICYLYVEMYSFSSTDHRQNIVRISLFTSTLYNPIYMWNNEESQVLRY